MIQQIPQRLQEVNTLLATCKQDSITFEQAMLLSLFYKDFNETNQIVTEAAAMFHDDATIIRKTKCLKLEKFTRANCLTI